ncbi:MAG: alpha/beta hydrolase [Ahrensia sp.]|nr:alpha/beta hydrolase [Ahrensia sp.]
MMAIIPMLIVFSSIFAILTPDATAQTLKSYKDNLFAYPKVLSEIDSGDFRIIDYQELRDINGRDDVPEKRVRAEYVDYAGTRATNTSIFGSSAGNVDYHYVGQLENAAFITVFIHGKGGDGRLGANDFSFGGNFNRLKMLMLRNKGLYLSPDAGGFSVDDVRAVSELVLDKLHQSPNAKLIISCGSAGGAVCYALADILPIAKRLNGIALLGSFWDWSYPKSAAGKIKVPIYIAHGSRDKVFAIEEMENFYRELRKSKIPVKMVRLETGTHGTPIRMIDWRTAINWMSTN